MNNEKLKDTLKSINWNHGRGDIRKIQVFDGTGTVYRQPYGMKLEKRKFRLSNNGKSVHFLGHKKIIK